MNIRDMQLKCDRIIAMANIAGSAANRVYTAGMENQPSLANLEQYLAQLSGYKQIITGCETELADLIASLVTLAKEHDQTDQPWSSLTASVEHLRELIRQCHLVMDCEQQDLVQQAIRLQLHTAETLLGKAQQHLEEIEGQTLQAQRKPEAVAKQLQALEFTERAKKYTDAARGRNRATQSSASEDLPFFDETELAADQLSGRAERILARAEEIRQQTRVARWGKWLAPAPQRQGLFANLNLVIGNWCVFNSISVDERDELQAKVA